MIVRTFLQPVEKVRERLGISGDMECPVCGTGNDCNWVGFKGHIHAEWSSTGCGQWIQ